MVLVIMQASTVLDLGVNALGLFSGSEAVITALL